MATAPLSPGGTPSPELKGGHILALMWALSGDMRAGRWSRRDLEAALGSLQPALYNGL